MCCQSLLPRTCSLWPCRLRVTSRPVGRWKRLLAAAAAAVAACRPLSSSHGVGDDNSRINRLLRSGLLISARRMFEEMPDRDIVSWNSMIAGYARDGAAVPALGLFKRMIASGTTKGNSRTFASILGACIDAGFHREGLQLHCRVVSLGFDYDLFVGSALVDLYMRIGSPDLALALFRGLPRWSTATCNSVLRGFCDLGHTAALLRFFASEMTTPQGMEPDGLSFCYLVRGCCHGGGRWLEEGRQLHGHVIKVGWAHSNLFVSNAVVDFYAASGDLTDARRAFDCIASEEDVISWNSMVAVCADHGSSTEALDLFRRMRWHGKRPSVRSFVGLLNLSSRTRDLAVGLQIHGISLKAGFACGSAHVQSALIDMYGKCRDVESSVLFFHEIPELNLECCNALMTSLLHCDVLVDVVEVFGLMTDEGVRPDHVTLSAALKAVSSSAAAASLVGCQMLHCCATKLGFERNEVASSSLVDAYARSGRIDLSRQIFEGVQDPNVVCFTAMISAYARNGMGREGVEMLGEMIRRGLKPDGVTFLCVLAGCDHSGLVDEGVSVLESMWAVHGVDPDRRHYSCMVSLLGRAGFLEEAMELMKVASFHCDPRMWSLLLHYCRVHGNEDIGKRAAKALMEVETRDASHCLQVFNFFTEISDLESWAQVGQMMAGIVYPRKEMGYSLIEVKDAQNECQKDNISVSS